jgi:hypothetical protein
VDVSFNQKLEALRLARDAELDGQVAEEQAYFEEQMDMLRQNMDTAQFERIWNSGCALKMEQALGVDLVENTG